MEMWTREAMERWFLCFILVLHPLASVFANMEADALHCLRTNLNDPNNVLQSWDPTLVNPCTWLHVTCNSENSVIRVDLGNAQLSGQLVPQLGQLKNLEYLELYNNTISGIIPTELGDLANLVSLDLYLNNFTGNIPDSLGKLTQLRFLRLNNNNLSGQIPVSLTNIYTLQVLDLSNNNLSGRVPSNGSFSLFTPISFANNPLLCGPGTTKACPGGPPLPPPPPLILPTPPSSPVSAMKVDRSKSGDALKSENRLAAKAPEKQKKGSRKTKDPNKPKRPPTAFFVFMEQFRKEFKEKNPNNKLVSVVGKAGGAKWKSMSDSEKAPYVAKADKLKDEYLKKMRSYNGLDGDKKSAADDESSDKSKSEVSELAGSHEEEDDD